MTNLGELEGAIREVLRAKFSWKYVEGLINVAYLEEQRQLRGQEGRIKVTCVPLGRFNGHSAQLTKVYSDGKIIARDLISFGPNGGKRVYHLPQDGEAILTIDRVLTSGVDVKHAVSQVLLGSRVSYQQH